MACAQQGVGTHRSILRSPRGHPEEDDTHSPAPPPQQLSSPLFGLELLSSGAFTAQHWVAGFPPWARRHVFALWPRFVAGSCRPKTVPQLGLSFMSVSSRHRAPAFLVRSWCRSRMLRSLRAPGLPASLVQHLL
ncbi:hypothetical protein NDU88_004657 [Pleurodeles waltl]|uniref:Uncharacterized protein n=1 Tax=Pleurodeles waltl TaxID=8319 RepID=A0AAV7LKF1_PLEWA|nr:hypothetical protein NDU88_004657 [Pleurodeles waltl]